MSLKPDLSLPSRDQLLSIIQIQSDVAKLGLDFYQVMSLVTERSVELLQSDGAVIELQESDEMVYRAAHGIAKGQLGLRLAIKNSMSGLCLTSGQIQYCADSETDPRVDRAACRLTGIRSMMVVPLRYADITVGVLKVISKTTDSFNKVDEAVLGILSDVLAAHMFYAAKYAMSDLYYKATHDEMTGLANRALFFDKFRYHLAQSIAHGRAIGLLIIDLDDLKGINDSYGHRAGDAAICEVARRIGEGVSNADLLARIGGDEFVIILRAEKALLSIDRFIRQLEHLISGDFVFESYPLSLSASIGYAVAPDHGQEIAGLIEVADQAMYSLKRQKKDGKP